MTARRARLLDVGTLPFARFRGRVFERVFGPIASTVHKVVSRTRRVACTGAGVTLVAGPPIFLGACASAPRESVREAPRAHAAFVEKVPTSAASIDMLPVPGSADGTIAPFWMSRTEVPWEAFDVFVYRLDEDAGLGPADAVTRPSKPYLPPDRGFGHDGYAAISMSYKNAAEFCRWLSHRTGRTYRLPTEAEWEHAARGTGPGAFSFGDDPATLPSHAWFADNADAMPHPIATKQPGPHGLHDLHGNVAEWVTGRDGKPVTKGGSYRDGPDRLAISARVPQSPAWNASDPQIPKSTWWLSDGPFVGFRIVCVDGPPSAPKDKP